MILTKRLLFLLRPLVSSSTSHWIFAYAACKLITKVKDFNSGNELNHTDEEKLPQFLDSDSIPFTSPGPRPTPRQFDNNALPELPSVPDTLPTSSLGGSTAASDDIDFDDLTRRFEELKKKT